MLHANADLRHRTIVHRHAAHNLHDERRTVTTPEPRIRTVADPAGAGGGAETISNGRRWHRRHRLRRTRTPRPSLSHFAKGVVGDYDGHVHQLKEMSAPIAANMRKAQQLLLKAVQRLLVKKLNDFVAR